MSLNINKIDDQHYTASATPPHVKEPWSTASALPVRELIKELQARGCHQQDIGDVLYELDPQWVEKL